MRGIFGEAGAVYVAFGGDGLVAGDDFGDGCGGEAIWGRDAAGLDVIDEADDEAVALVVFGLTPGDEVGAEEIVPVVIVVGVADEVGAGDED